MSTPPLVLPNGHTDVPAGKIASVVTYLEMTGRPPSRSTPSQGLELSRLGPDDAARYRAVYRAIGERWFWFSRLGMTVPELRGVLSKPGVEAFEAAANGRVAGLLEIDFSVEGEAEIVFFGLVEDFVGKGAGRWLMNRAMDMIWSRPVRRVWLHTCTLDHPGAVAFYCRSGFRPYRSAIEIADDPRVTGVLPPGSFPNVPLLLR